MKTRRKLKGFVNTKYDHERAGLGKFYESERYKGDCMPRHWSRFLDIPYLEMWNICAGLNWNAGRERTGDNRVREWRQLADHFGFIQVGANEEEDLKSITDWYQTYDSFLAYEWDNRGWWHWWCIIDGVMHDFKSKNFEFWWRFKWGEYKPKVILIHPDRPNSRAEILV